MEFYIKQNSTLPILKMEIIKDGRSDFNLNSFLSGSSTFLISIYDKSNDKFLFASKECFVISEYSDFEGKELYYLNYQFTNKDTLKTGRYEVQVSILSDQGVILLPLQEKYYVNVLESFSVDNLGYSTLYSANLPCCGFQETFDVDGITLDAYYYSGSLIIDYVLTSTKIYNQDITVDFTNVLEVFTGEPIEITTGVTISSGQTRGITQIIFEGYDYNNLTQRSYLKNVIINENFQDTIFNFDETLIFNTPAPTAAPTSTPTPTITPSVTPTITRTQTKTPTQTKTQTKTPTQTVTQTPSITPSITPSPTNPCVEYITDEFGNFILTENGDYIISEINPCISPTPTKTPTPTPTNTPTLSITPSITSTLTPTITPSSSEPLYPLTINIQSMSGGESIIFDEITYTANTTVNILLNTPYLIEAVPSPGYILGGWGGTGVLIDFLSGNTFTVSMNFTGGSSITPQYEEIPSPTPTPTVTPTMTETPTNTVTPTPTLTPTPTPATLPTVTTDGYGSLFNGAAQITGTIVSNGGSTITERGIVWGTSPNPTIANNTVSDGSGNPDTLGQFVHTYTMSPNPHGTPVYVRIYATNAIGTSYGTQVSFTMPCFIKGTKITLASGLRKNIEDISYDDSLLVWNFDEGRFDSANPIWIMAPVLTQYVNILFSDGSNLGISGHLNHDGGHRIFNLDKGEFTYAIPNEHSPIGTRTFNDKGDIVTIVGKEESTEVEEIYNVVTNRHLNIFAEGILTSRRLNNLYPIEDMKFIKDERSITSIEEFKGVPVEYYEGLRLGEQPLATNSEGFLVKTPGELAYTLPTVNELEQWTVEFIKKKS